MLKTKESGHLLITDHVTGMEFHECKKNPSSVF